ncbi:MAG: hypothetical protein OEV73_00135 [Desulfobulbaceae bacterium]|nr:hypothetical protein [Desulfobulbaceae bacterium]
MANELATPRDGVQHLRTRKHTHNAAVAANEIIVVNGDILIAVSAALANVENVYIYRGRASFPKTTGASSAIADGKECFWDATNGVATESKGMSAADAVADGGNTGNGTVTGEAVGANAVAESWTLLCIAAAANGGTFSVIGSKSGRMADAEVGVAYANGFVAFTINDGATDFVVGDKFTLAVTQANSKIGKSAEPTTDDDDEVMVMLNEN